MFHLAILFVLLLPIPILNIPSKSKSSSIFVNNLGSSRISTSKLTLLTYVNVSYLNEANFILNRYYSKSLSLCKQVTETTQRSIHISFHCERTLELIKQRLTEINVKDEILNHISLKETRKRRGFIDGFLGT